MVATGVRIKQLLLLTVSLVFITSCANDNGKHVDEKVIDKLPEVSVPEFSPDSAYKYIEQQLAFGPRVPNTKEHKKCGDFLIKYFKGHADTLIVQKTTVKAFNNIGLKLRNIIASWNPEAGRRVLLCAHWDTRPFADQDRDRPADPIPGANDGGSGVAVLMELARLFALQDPGVGVDIILFDGEDYGQPERSPFPRMQDSYCLGSQYWAKNLHKKNYYADFGILLDMVGAKGARFTKEGSSMYYASNVVKKVWERAYKLGHSSFFPFEETKAIIDDHVYINRLANIPTIDIIQYDQNTASNFGDYWHTHKDDIDVIDKSTLNAVGETVAAVVYNYGSGS